MDNEKIKHEIIEKIRSFPKKAEKRFEELGIYNKRDPIQEMDDWAQTQKKDITWVERSTKEILENRKHMFDDLSRERIFEKMGTGLGRKPADDPAMDKRVEDCVKQLEKDEAIQAAK